MSTNDNTTMSTNDNTTMSTNDNTTGYESHNLDNRTALSLLAEVSRLLENHSIGIYFLVRYEALTALETRGWIFVVRTEKAGSNEWASPMQWAVALTDEGTEALRQPFVSDISALPRSPFLRFA